MYTYVYRISENGSESMQLLTELAYRIGGSIPINWIRPYQVNDLSQTPSLWNFAPRCRREVPKGLSDTVPPIQHRQFFWSEGGKGGVDGRGCGVVDMDEMDVDH